jgi:hypothetical protein
MLHAAGSAAGRLGIAEHHAIRVGAQVGAYRSP